MKRQIIDTIEKYDKIIILRHVRPDPDAYGSQLGLKALIELNYPDKKVMAGGEHDGGLAFLGKPQDLDKTDYQDALVIVTDTGNTERIDSPYYAEGQFLMKIDHHPNVDPYGDLKWVDTSASSTSEMIAILYEEGKKYYGWKMNEEAARFLYAGIVGDTGRFMFPSTTETTFSIASELIKYHFDRQELYAGMYEVSRELLQLKGFIYQNFEMDENGCAFIKLTQETLKEFNVSVAETSLLVGTLGDVKGICAWVIFIEEADQIRVRLRSKGPVINTLAARYGGGGHPLASGASVHTWEEADQVIMELEQLCR